MGKRAGGESALVRPTVYLTVVKPPPSARELFEAWIETATEIEQAPLSIVRERVSHRKVKL